MNFQKALEILSKDIEEIEKILAGLEKSDQENVIILKLALSKLANFRENLNILASADVEDKKGDPDTDTKVPVTKDITVLQESNPAEKKHDNKQKTVAVEKTKVPEGKEEIHKKQSQGTTKDPLSVKKDRTVLSDRYQSQHFRNESLAKTQTGKKLSAKLQEQPIIDIYRSIALNERFQFIRELFNGDSKAFNTTIRFLNQATSIEEAERFLTDNFEWDPENELVMRLHNLVRRKLKSN